MLKKQKADCLFEILYKTYGNVSTELNYVNPYTLLVAVLLSAQAKDSAVNLATKKLFEIVTNPHDMLELGYDNLVCFIKSIGLYKTKASNIIGLSKILIEEFAKIVPNNMQDLITLPGIGRKSANVILNVIFKQPTMPVDTHVYRIARRTGLAVETNILNVENKLLAIIPDQYKLVAHHLLIMHGRYVCKAKKFDCTICPLNEICEKNV